MAGKMTQVCDDHRLRNLSPTEAWLGGAAAHAKVIAMVCIGILAMLGWLYLGLTTAGMLDRPAGAIGSETGLADPGAWPDWYGLLGRSFATPIQGKNKSEPVVIRNSEYWVAPDVTVARADKSRVRAFGHNWNFAGRSAEVCALDWGNG